MAAGGSVLEKAEHSAELVAARTSLLLHELAPVLPVATRHGRPRAGRDCRAQVGGDIGGLLGGKREARHRGHELRSQVTRREQVVANPSAVEAFSNGRERRSVARVQDVRAKTGLRLGAHLEFSDRNLLVTSKAMLLQGRR